MPINPSKATSFLLLPDYPPDKVCYKVKNSVSVPQAANIADTVTVTIPHGLGFAPLPMGIYANTSGFTTWYEFGTSQYRKSPTFNFWGPIYMAVAEADTTNLYITFFNDTGSTQTIYYDVICLIPSNVSSVVAMDAAGRDDVLFDSSSNYLKTYLDGFVDVSYDGINSQTTTIAHNLGVLPLAIVFSEQGGRTRRVGAEEMVGVTGLTNQAAVDVGNLYIYGLTTFPTAQRFHYKVYLNE